MGELRDKIQETVKEAMKARDQLRVNTVRGLFSEIRRAEIDEKKELSDEQIVNIIQKEIKKRRDAIDFAKKADRADLIGQNQTEIEMLQFFVGAPLTDDELKSQISTLIAGGAQNLGAVMGELNKQFKGRFDGKVASEMIKGMLA